MKRLSNLLGLDRDREPNLTEIAVHLDGGEQEFAVEAWGGLPRRLFALHAARYANPDDEAENGLDYDWSAFAEIFASSAGRLLSGRVTLLGRSDSETQQGDTVDLWASSGRWAQVAMSGDWRLSRHSANGGVLYTMEYIDGEDAGCRLAYWFFVHGV